MTSHSEPIHTRRWQLYKRLGRRANRMAAIEQRSVAMLQVTMPIVLCVWVAKLFGKPFDLVVDWRTVAISSAVPMLVITMLMVTNLWRFRLLEKRADLEEEIARAR